MSGRNLGKSQLNKDNQTFTYISLAVSVILAIFFYYCLFSHSIENAPETTGEIFISEGQASEVDKDTSFIGFLFDYFGSVSYLFPLVIIHLGVLIPHIDFNIRRLNLFKAGLYILGFDCAILGLTSVYSNLFSRGTTGGGGVLGDFFSLEGASYFSSSLTVIIALLLSVTGIFLMIGRNPVLVLETIGAFACNLVLKDKKAQDSQDEGGKSTSKLASLKAKLSSFTESKNEDEEEAQEPTGPALRQGKGYKNEARDLRSAFFERKEPSFERQEPSFGFDNSASFKAQEKTQSEESHSDPREAFSAQDTFNPQDEYAQGQEALEAQNFSKQIEDEDKKVTTIYERDPNYQNSFAQNAQGTEPSLQEPYAAFRENDNLSYGKENKDFKPHLNEPYQTELPLDSQGFGAQDNVPAQGFGASDLQNYQNFRAQEPQGAAEFGSQENPYAQKSLQEPSDFVNPQDRAYEREAFSQGQYAGVNDNYKIQDNASFVAQNAYAPHNLEDFKEDDVFGKLSFAEQNARNRDLLQESGKEEPSSTIITRHSPQESFNERVELKPNADEPAYITPGVRGAFKPKVEAESLDDENKVSTIITKGPQNLDLGVQKAQEVVQEQVNEGISTVITHGDSSSLAFQDKNSPQEEEDDGIHSYITRTPPKLSAQNSVQGGSGYEEENLQNLHESEHIINFNDYPQKEQPSFEIGDLDTVPPPKPSLNEQAVQDAEPSYKTLDHNFLQPKDGLKAPSSVISEKDLPEDYKSASRGVFGEPQKSSHESSADPKSSEQEPTTHKEDFVNPNLSSNSQEKESATDDFENLSAEFESAQELPKAPLNAAEADRALREKLASVALEVEEAQKFASTAKSIGQKSNPFNQAPERLVFSERMAAKKAQESESQTVTQDNALPYLQEGSLKESTKSQESLPSKDPLVLSSHAQAPREPQSVEEPYHEQVVDTQRDTATTSQALAQGFVQSRGVNGEVVSQGVNSNFNHETQGATVSANGISREQGSLDNTGFMGRSHNSSSSNLPGYINPQEQLSSFETPKVPLSNITCPTKVYDDWLPDPHLVSGESEAFEVSDEECFATADRIDRCLQEFNVRANVADYLAGPVITCYELALEPGVKSSTISSLASDICRKLMVETLRIVDVVPGTSFMGIEVPNAKRKMIMLGSLMQSAEYKQSKAILPIILGVNTKGEPIVVDLAKAPHLLICGTTGSGKSVGLQAIIVSLIMRLSPKQLRLILIDPKRVELSFYENLPHLLTPVIADVEEKAGLALRWCVEEMERRYNLISQLRVRNLEEYNQTIRAKHAQGEEVYDPNWNPSMGGRPATLQELPCIVICVEEYADLMSQTKGRKNDNSPDVCIARLAAKARAAGIYMILATQTPRADVVTPVIKNNIPSRIAYTVQSGIDSRVIIDEVGAEKLLGNGDMIFKFSGVQRGQAVRAHSGFISNDDIKRVVDAWHDHAGDPEFVAGVTETPPEEIETSSEEAAPQLDKLFDQAAAYARDFIERKKKNPAISDFQVTLGVGYPRAKKIYGQLEREGVLLN